MTVQFYHNGDPSASLAVWMYIVPDATMRCPVLLGRDSWMRFTDRSYRALRQHPTTRALGELTLLHITNEHPSGATAYTRHPDTPETSYHLVYDGDGLSLGPEPQLVPVNLVRSDGSPALTGH